MSPTGTDTAQTNLARARWGVGSRLGWLFPGERDPGLPVHPSTLAGWPARVAQQAGVETVGLHAVRHTVATSLVEAGYVAGARRRLRHRWLDTTLRHYVDTTEVDDTAVADDIQRQLLTGGSSLDRP